MKAKSGRDQWLQIAAYLLWACSSYVRAATTGLRCFHCNEAATPNDCDKWAICGAGEVCFTQEFTTRDGYQGYRMGCETQTRCDIFKNAEAILGILGRRDLERVSRSDSPCYECCSSTDCNARNCMGAPTNQPSYVNSGANGHSCPPTFYTGPAGCYFIGYWQLSWGNARVECQRRGAGLASLNSQEEKNFLVRQIKLLDITRVDKTAYWLGGYYAAVIGEWNWVDMTGVNFTSWGVSQPQYNDNDYRIAMLNPASNKGFRDWAWATLGQSSSYSFICESGFLK